MKGHMKAKLKHIITITACAMTALWLLPWADIWVRHYQFFQWLNDKIGNT
jgi:hypothetical protein